VGINGAPTPKTFLSHKDDSSSKVFIICERITRTEAIIMKILNLCGVLRVMLFLLGTLIFSACDSGEKVIDKATGNQDVKQFQKMKKDIGKIADQQAERYNQIPDDKKN